MSGPAQACHNSELILFLSPSPELAKIPFEGAFMLTDIER